VRDTKPGSGIRHEGYKFFVPGPPGIGRRRKGECRNQIALIFFNLQTSVSAPLAALREAVCSP
jgi:hypothetical protein